MTKNDEVSALKRRFAQNKQEKEGGIIKPEIFPSQRLVTAGMVDTRRIGVISDISWRLGVMNPNNFRSSTSNVPRRVIRNRIIVTFVVLVILGLLRVWYE